MIWISTVILLITPGVLLKPLLLSDEKDDYDYSLDEQNPRHLRRLYFTPPDISKYLDGKDLKARQKNFLAWKNGQIHKEPYKIGAGYILKKQSGKQFPPAGAEFPLTNLQFPSAEAQLPPSGTDTEEVNIVIQSEEVQEAFPGDHSQAEEMKVVFESEHEDPDKPVQFQNDYSYSEELKEVVEVDISADPGNEELSHQGPDPAEKEQNDQTFENSGNRGIRNTKLDENQKSLILFTLPNKLKHNLRSSVVSKSLRFSENEEKPESYEEPESHEELESKKDTSRLVYGNTHDNLGISHLEDNIPYEVQHTGFRKRIPLKSYGRQAYNSRRQRKAFSSSSEEEIEKNPGNPYTLYKDNYLVNYPYNFFMDGDHMNIDPKAPKFPSMEPSATDLFYRRKWWYFNQDDFLPFRRR